MFCRLSPLPNVPFVHLDLITYVQLLQFTPAQAWSERLQVVLLLNKIDRLILELKMSVSEAAAALTSIVTGR
jgi:hypothetical protein